MWFHSGLVGPLDGSSARAYGLSVRCVRNVK